MAESAERFVFSRQQRLLSPAEYSAVFSARRVLRGSSFVLHYRINGLSGSRLGLVIPKKQARTAVLRNAIKRQARELFRQQRQQPVLLPSLDLILRLAQPVGPSGRLKHSIDKQVKAAWRDEMTTLFNQLSRKLAP